MSNFKQPASVAPYGAARRDQLLAAFSGQVPPIAVGPAYRLALFFAAVAMLLLPLVYLALIALVSYATYWHAVEDARIFQMHLRGKVAMMLYLGPLITGILLVFFLVKPFLAPRGKARPGRAVRREDQPLLHDFVGRVCAAVGAPAPSRIEVDCRVNASAGLRRGLRSLVGKNDLVLVIGMPLVHGLSLEQLAGVLAHEFGHFAQSAGMRLSYLVRRINDWFAQVVYGRDQWDEQLEQAAKADTHFFVLAIVQVARGAVWLSRQLLKGLMYLGHAISSYLMRQMEFDADRYEARLVGAEVFAATCHEMSYLGAAFERSLADVGLAWRDRHLADDLPRLVADHRRELDADLLRKIAGCIAGSKAVWSDSHPADSERLAAARRERGEPVFRSQLPAEVLFRDLAALSREVSSAFYREELELPLDGVALQPTQDLFAKQQELRTGIAAGNRLLRQQFDLFLAPSLPRRDSGMAETDPAKALAELRRRQEEGDLQLAKAQEHFDRFLPQLNRLGAAATLVEMGIPLAKNAFGLSDTSAAGIASRRQELERRLAQLRPTLESGLELAGSRAATALGWLERRDWAPAEEVLEAGRLRPVVAALADQRPLFEEMRRNRNEAAVYIEVLRNGIENAEPVAARLRAVAESLAEDVIRLRGALAEVPYPFQHARESVDLGAYLVPEPPSPGDPGGAIGATNQVFNQAALLGARAWGRIARIVEKVEEELGLPPLELPDQPEEAAAAA